VIGASKTTLMVGDSDKKKAVEWILVCVFK